MRPERAAPETGADADRDRKAPHRERHNKHAHETPRESRAVLDALFDSAPVGIGFWDRNFRFIRVNPWLASINGISPAEHVGRTPPELLPELESIGNVLELWQKVLDSGTPTCVDVSGSTPAAPHERRHWREHFFPVRLDGEVVGLGAVIEDVTEQRRNEKQLQSNLRRFRGFAQNIDDIVWLADCLKQRTLYVNPAFRRVWQRSEQELYDDFMVWRSAIHPEDRQRVIDAFESSSNDRYDVEYRITRPDGTERLVRERGFPIGDPGTGLKGGIAEDITERRAAAIRLLKQERRYERIFNLTGASIWELDCTAVRNRLLELRSAGVADLRAHLRAAPDEIRRLVAAGRVISVNKATLDLFKADDVDSLIQRSPELYDTETEALYLELFEAIWTGRTRIQYDAAARSFDGRRLHLAVNATLSSTEETPFEVLISATDITALKRTQFDLREADERKDQFLAVLAHELLNPLAAIRAAAELLRLPDRDPAGSQRIGEVLCRQTDQLTRLSDDLLDVSRVAQGKVKLDLSVVDLRAVISQAIDPHRKHADERQQVVQLELSDEPACVMGDPARLVQCVSNLVHNAVKYTPEHGAVLVRVAREGNDVVVRVRDNGIGIPPEKLDVVFDLYAQIGHRAETVKGGLGIGLNVVKRLVEMHGGSVAAHSEGPGRGSEFSIRLPRVTAPARTAAPDVDTAAISKSVLVVDDNADAAEMTCLLLRDLGCSVRCAPDGEAAIDAVEQSSPDAILLDIGLPRMDGYEVAATLRSKGYGGRLIALTGFGRSEDRQTALAAGFDHHVVKPGNLRTLRELLR
jgi:PAS domain S-box-containing protein